MSSWVPVPVVVPLLAAAFAIVVGRWRALQRIVSLVALAAVLVAAVVLLVGAERDGIVVAQAGGWPAPVGITLAADRTSAFLLVIAAVTLLAVLVYAVGQGGVERERVGFHPLYLVLTSGVALTFLTGDLFNMFVAFEMMLAASYVLITLGGRADQVRSGMTYVVISLIASTLFLAVLAWIYSATGTVNLADLSVRMAELPDGVRTAFALALFVTFGIKAAVFPLFFWLPDSYPTAPGPITAIFAGILTKVGVYAIVRTQTLLVPPESRPETFILVIAGLTMVVGVLGAIAQYDAKRILSFHIVSQIGYMIMGLGLFTELALAAAVLYIANQILLKTTLFLVTGLVERRAGSSRLAEIGGLVRRAPLLAVLFALPALSLAGMPPFSGFVAKFGLASAGVQAEAYTIVAVSLAVSLLTLFSMTKIWSNVFWGEPDEEPARPPVVAGRLGGPPLMVGATSVMVAAGLAVAVAAGPVWAFAERAAADLLAPERYVAAVLGGG
jgi:multicomponent Na+:H+ antiporter subunit D